MSMKVDFLLKMSLDSCNDYTLKVQSKYHTVFTVISNTNISNVSVGKIKILFVNSLQNKLLKQPTLQPEPTYLSNFLYFH